MTHVITSDMYEQIATGIISGLIGILGAYAILKTATKPEKILDILDMTLDELTQNVEMQKKVYLMGVLLGNGVKQGMGLSTKGGKFKMENIIGQGLQFFLSKMMGGQQNQQEGQSSQLESPL